MQRVVERHSPLNGVRVLLVEDYALVREVIGRLLVEYGAKVTATTGTAEALQAFERERPDAGGRTGTRERRRQSAVRF